MIRSYQRVLTKCMIPANTKNGPKSLLMSRSLWTERRPRLGDREALLVQGPADDHALHVLDPEAGDRAQVVEGADAAGIDQIAIGRLRDLAQRIEGRPLHQAVDLDRRVDETPQPPPRQLGDHLSGPQ